jgi:hypothetical protein
VSIATHYGASKINALIPNLATYHRVLHVMVPSCVYASDRDREPSCLMAKFLSFQPPNENHQLRLTKPHH